MQSYGTHGGPVRVQMQNRLYDFQCFPWTHLDSLGLIHGLLRVRLFGLSIFALPPVCFRTYAGHRTFHSVEELLCPAQVPASLRPTWQVRVCVRCAFMCVRVCVCMCEAMLAQAILLNAAQVVLFGSDSNAGIQLTLLVVDVPRQLCSLRSARYRNAFGSMLGVYRDPHGVVDVR